MRSRAQIAALIAGISLEYCATAKGGDKLVASICSKMYKMSKSNYTIREVVTMAWGGEVKLSVIMFRPGFCFKGGPPRFNKQRRMLFRPLLCNLCDCAALVCALMAAAVEWRAAQG